MVNPKIKEILSDRHLIEIRDRWFQKLEAVFDGTSQVHVPAVDGIYGSSETDAYHAPERWAEEALDSLSEKAGKLQDEMVFRPLCLEFGPYGVHFIDKILGAEVFFDHDSKQWYNKYLGTPVGSLQYPDLEKNETWNLAKRIAAAFLKQEVKLPLFGLPTIASVLNIAVNLYGEKVLLEMCVNPENAVRDFKVINRLLCSIHRWYLENIPVRQLQPVVSGHRTQPVGYGQICGCTTQLISEEMYRAFVATFDDQLLSVYPKGGMIHLCGSHTQHIPVWREMKSLRAVQVNDRAAKDLEQYFRGLRDDQIIFLNPCEEMSIEKAMEITGGKRLIIAGSIEKHLTVK